MKLISRVLLLFLGIAAARTSSSFAQSGWISQPGGLGSLNSVSFADAKHGAAVGAAGFFVSIVCTTDGGDTWSSYGLPATVTLYAISFPRNVDSAIAVGQESRGRGAEIWHSSSGCGGGFQFLPNTPALLGVSFVDADTYTAVGDGFPPPGGHAIILRNGTRQESGTTNTLFSVSFADATTGTTVGDRGTIVHTTNGGDTWILQDSGTSNALFGVSIVDANSGWAVGAAGTILSTSDGLTWTFQNTGTSNDLHGVSFVDANTGWVVGQAGTILHTTDGGNTWTLQDSGTTDGLSSVSFVDANTGWAVGGGTILHTTTGGESR